MKPKHFQTGGSGIIRDFPDLENMFVSSVFSEIATFPFLFKSERWKIEILEMFFPGLRS